MIRPMRLAINRQRAGAANAFTAVRIERDRFFSALDQVLVNDVEHFEKRSVRRNVVYFIIDESSFRPRVRLSPDLEVKIHG